MAKRLKSEWMELSREKNKIFKDTLQNPFLEEMRNLLNECNAVKFATYRTSSKLRIIQKKLFMDKVSLKIIRNIFHKHQLWADILNSTQVESILSDIYFAFQKSSRNRPEIDKDSISSLLTLLIMNIYDKKVKNKILVHSCKIFLALICDAQPEEKFKFMFHEMADQDDRLSKDSLQILLKNVIDILDFIGEGQSFSRKLIPQAVENCFEKNLDNKTVSEHYFLSWLNDEPQMFVWLSVLYRMQIAEKVLHNIKCGICKIHPLMGLRYTCLKCISYNICQTCFFIGKLSKGHKLEHPIQEYCFPISAPQATKAFLKTLRNKVLRKNLKIQYIIPFKREESDSTLKFKDNYLLAFAAKELYNVIVRPEDESIRFNSRMDNVRENLDNDWPNRKQVEIDSPLSRQKAANGSQSKTLKPSKKTKIEHRGMMASTPVAKESLLENTKRREFNKDLEKLSPIKLLDLSIEDLKQNDKTKNRPERNNYDLVVNDHAGNSWPETKEIFKSSRGSAPKTEAILSLSKASEETKQNEIKYSTTWENSIHDSKQSKSYFISILDDSKQPVPFSVDDTCSQSTLGLTLRNILQQIRHLSTIMFSSSNLYASDDMRDRAGKIDSILLDLIVGIEKLAEA